MPRARQLKVFRTPIGFHDAYVAAPSQKAALEAWGADSNLFASRSAERVEDPELMREPLAAPGQVIRRLRGTLDEHIAALPKDAPPSARRRQKLPSVVGEAAPEAPKAKPPRPAKPKPAPKPKPRPDRAPLDQAEAALGELEKRQAGARAALARRQAELDRERHALEARQARERQQLEKRIAAAHDRYERAMRVWREA